MRESSFCKRLKFYGRIKNYFFVKRVYGNREGEQDILFVYIMIFLQRKRLTKMNYESCITVFGYFLGELEINVFFIY